MYRYLLFFVSLSLFANTYNSGDVNPKPLSTHGNIVMGSIWQNLGWPVETSPKFEPSPAPTPKPVPVPSPKIKPVPKPIPEPTPKKLSKGESKVQEMLRKNRERLKNQRTVWDKEKEEKNSNLSLKEQYLRNLDRMKRKNLKTLSSWKEQREKTLKHWKKKQQEFLEQLEDFKKATFHFESASYPVSQSKLKKPIVTPVKDKFYVIPGALDIDIKNQGKRPTCAAFAGVRAVETLLAANERSVDLSEQYLYWSAKPNCKQSPCKRRGSWVTKPFNYSKNKGRPDIPLERSCPYSKLDRPSNQTHIPLDMGCRQGAVQVTGFSRVETVDGVLSSLKLNQPVVAGFKLSPNFYQNNGLVTYLNSKSSGKLDEHAAGHALLLIGYIKLPPELTQRGEGKVCFLAANSWGEGWGQGGYSCLTESWVRHYRIKNAFMALNSAKIN